MARFSRRQTLMGLTSSLGALTLGAHQARAIAGGYIEDAAPVNGARIQGTLRYEGPPIDLGQVLVTKDAGICRDGLRDLHPLRVKDDGALADGVIQIKGMDRGKPWDPVFSEAKIYQIDCSFQPYVQIVRASAEAEIINLDPLLHNIHAYEVFEKTRRTMFNFAQPREGQVDRIPLKLRRGHLVAIDCNAHNWMKAWIYTSTTPYLSVTSIDGRFEISGIPPGQYELTAWHPVVGEENATLTVGAGDDFEFDLVLT